NAREKKNYEEIIKFFPKDLSESFNADPAKLEREITDIDDYEIKEVYKPGFAGENQYAARVRIFKDGAPISPPTGDTWPVFLVKENGGFKVKTWFLNLPVSDR
ncbi:MAG: hypothetical protein Q8L57_00250, partial [bacterium]|nr:hypothetical protein [bacterium]